MSCWLLTAVHRRVQGGECPPISLPAELAVELAGGPACVLRTA